MEKKQKKQNMGKKAKAGKDRFARKYHHFATAHKDEDEDNIAEADDRQAEVGANANEAVKNE